jgi:hypothetical protein
LHWQEIVQSEPRLDVGDRLGGGVFAEQRHSDAAGHEGRHEKSQRRYGQQQRHQPRAPR